MLNDEDFGAILLTLQLASLVTVILLLLGTPIAWWLAHARSRWKGIIGAVVALPLVLPPAVLGFYLLVLMGPHGAVFIVTHHGAQQAFAGKQVEVVHPKPRHFFLQLGG